MVECQQAVTAVGRNDPGGGLEAHPTLRRDAHSSLLCRAPAVGDEFPDSVLSLYKHSFSARKLTALKIGFVSLGCPKNLVDTEVMMGQLVARGHELTPHPDEADVIVVNTCSFIDPAKQESVDTILEMAEYKKTGRAKKLIVAGCLVERYRGDIRRTCPKSMRSSEPTSSTRSSRFAKGRRASDESRSSRISITT